MSREYNHEYGNNNEILFSDKNSLKSEFGTHTPEAYDPNDPRFLQEVIVPGVVHDLHAFIINPTSEGIDTGRGYAIGSNRVVVELEGEDGGYTLCSIHNSQIING